MTRDREIWRHLFGWTALALAALGWLCVGAIVLGVMAVLWGIG